MRGLSILLLLLLVAVPVWLLWPAAQPLPLPDEGAPAGQGAPTPPTPPARAELDADASAVEVVLETLAKILPPLPGPTFEVWRGEQRLPVRAFAVGGAGAGDFEPLPGDRSLVRVELGDVAWYRAVTPAAEGATRVDCGPPCRVAGRVTDAAGAPLGGASVWVGAVAADGGLVQVQSEADGAFTTDALQGSGVPLVVQAPGCASRGQWLDLDFRGAADVVVALGPETVLTVQCRAVADELHGARIGVLPGAVASTAMLQYPFFLQAVQGLCDLDADGGAQLRGLPRDADVQLVALHPLAMRSPAVAVELRGEHVQASVPLRLLPPLSGRVRDVDGQGLPGVLLRMQLRDGAAPPPGRWMLPEALGLHGSALAATDADGRFRIGAAAGAALTVRWPGDAGLQLPVGGPGPLPRELVLPAWDQAPTVLQVPPPGGGAWQVRVRPLQDGFTAVAAGQPFALPLPEPMWADLTVKLRRGETWLPPKTRRGVLVLGTFAVPGELLQP